MLGFNEKGYKMANFNTWLTWRDVNKTSAKLAISNGLELMIHRNTDTDDLCHRLEIWPEDDSQEAPYVSYTIQQDGSSYLYAKYQDIHKELSKVEELPLRIDSLKQLNSVIKHIADSLAS